MAAAKLTELRSSVLADRIEAVSCSPTSSG